MSTTSFSAFMGGSTYANDLQSVLSRAVAIRSLGLNSLNTAKARIEGKSTAVGGLDTVFTNLKNSIAALSDATGVASLAASTSSTGIADATLSAGALPGSYSIEVTNLGASTSMMSKDALIAVSDPATQNIAAGTDFTLTIDGADTAITPSATNLNSLVSAINAKASLNVQASIVNVGSSGSPDYRLALRSTKLGPVSIQLKGVAAPLLDTLATGELASYKINGRANQITSDSRTVTLAPGLSIHLRGESDVGVATTITVASSTASVSNALSSFASAYNAAAAEINKYHGPNGGSLAGDSLLSTLQQSLHQISFYASGTASLADLTSLGFSFDKAGVLSFDAAALSSATSGGTGALNAFLGDGTSGFIKAANGTLAALEDPVNGLVKTTLASLAAQSSSEDALIAAEQTRIDQFNKDMTARISAADALIAGLQQRDSFITGLFAAQATANNANK